MTHGDITDNECINNRHVPLIKGDNLTSTERYVEHGARLDVS